MISDYIETPFDDCDIEWIMKIKDDADEAQAMQEIYDQIDAEMGEMFPYSESEVIAMERYYLDALEYSDNDYRMIKYIG